MLLDLATRLQPVARWIAGAAFLLSLVVAGTHWAVRRGSLTAFGGWARWVRSWSDRFLRPIEERVVRAGGNPQDAIFWLVGAAVVGGLALIAVSGWLAGMLFDLASANRYGRHGLLILIIQYAVSLVMLALIIRVVASWISISRYSKPMRLVYGMTDWVVEPIRRVLPTFGPFDFSPFLAYLLLQFGKDFVIRLLL